MGEKSEYDAVIQLLVKYWGGEWPADPNLLNECWKLAELILNHLPNDKVAQIEQTPHKYFDTIASELARLVQQDVIIRSLTDTLAITLQAQHPPVQPAANRRSHRTPGQIVRIPQGTTISINLSNSAPSITDTTPTLDLEMVFISIADDVWHLIVTLRDAEGRTDEILVPQPGVKVQFDHKTLNETSSIEEYGLALGRMLFADNRLRTAFNTARQRAIGAQGVVRLRLHAEPNDSRFHALCWELLTFSPDIERSPDFLVTVPDILLVRYLPSAHKWKTTLPTRQQLRVLVAIAAPQDLEVYNLSSVDSDAEIQRVWPALEGFARQRMTGTTPHRLAKALEIGIDILYLVCHGSVQGDETYLWLEDGNGHVKRISGIDFITMIANLPNPPQLIVLTACYGAGKKGIQNGSLLGLGPRLAANGVGAVLVMNERAYFSDMEVGIPVLFEVLGHTGRIDLAVGAMRRVLRESNSWWKPVLFVRLRDGRLFR